LDILGTTQQPKKRMKSIEYQAFIKLRDNVWTTVFNEIVQDWTTPKCSVIAKQVHSVTHLNVDAKSIQRFANLLENQVATNRTKYILAMFIAKQKSPDSQSQQIEKTLWYQLIQDFQSETQQNVVSENPISVYAGKYTMYYKKLQTNKLSNEVHITIQEDGNAIFQSVNTNFILKGEVFVMQSNPNLFFIFKNNVEYVFMIVQVGATNNKHYLSYLGGILSSMIRETSYPYSMITLLVKKTEQEIDLKRIDAYFTQISDNQIIALEQNIIKILDIRKNIEDLTNPTIKRLLNLIGNWYLYSHSSEIPNSISRGILEISNSLKVNLKSTMVDDLPGNIKLKGNARIVIELENENISIQFILDIQYRQILNFDMKRILYSSTGVLNPSVGIAILEKVPQDQQLTTTVIHPNSDSYQILEQKGIIAELKVVPDIYL
jgi:hypothetical protein